MKTFSILNKFRKNITMFAALAGTALFLNSCKNDINQTTPAIAALAVINAYPTETSTLDFFLGNERVNNTGLAFGGDIKYFNAYEGARTADVTISGNSTKLVSKSITLKGGIYHSLYVIGESAEKADFLLIEDELSNPAANKVHLRFANLSPDAGALELEIENDETVFEDRVYKAFTPFKSVPAVKSKFILKDKATGDVVATKENVDLKQGAIYTVWAKGLATSESDVTKLSVEVTPHFKQL
jgi:hypothetical protein